MSASWKLQKQKSESRQQDCEKEALNSLRRGDTASARHYIEKADKINGQAKVVIPSEAWEVHIVPKGPDKPATSTERSTGKTSEDADQ